MLCVTRSEYKAIGDVTASCLGSSNDTNDLSFLKTIVACNRIVHFHARQLVVLQFAVK